MSDDTLRPGFWTAEPLYDHYVDQGERPPVRHSIQVDKRKYRIRFENESEDAVTIILEPCVNKGQPN